MKELISCFIAWVITMVVILGANEIYERRKEQKEKIKKEDEEKQKWREYIKILLFGTEEKITK
jgi:hypothetical protein